MINLERAILADREALQRAEHLAAQETTYPMIKAAYEADVEYLRILVEARERLFFAAHGIE